MSSPVAAEPSSPRAKVWDRRPLGPSLPYASDLGSPAARHASSAVSPAVSASSSGGRRLFGPFLSITGRNSNSTEPRDQPFFSLSWPADINVSASTAAKLDKEGLSRMSLATGSVHLIVMSIVLSVFPAYFWLLHTLNLWVLIPVWYVRVVRKRKGQWFIVEPCWVVNCFMGLYFAASALGVLSQEVQLLAFRGCFELSLGFLSWSVLVSQNACIFHSVSTMAALSIHLMPGLVFLTLRWQKVVGSGVEEVWPNTFPSVAVMEGSNSWQLFVAGFVVYAVWWVLYLVWLLWIGVDLPDRGIPTIYNTFRKKHLKVFQKTGLQTQRGQVVVYMVIHLVLCSATFAWAIACWWSFYMHLVWFCMLLLFAVWQSADYYAREVFEKCASLPARRAAGAQDSFAEPLGGVLGGSAGPNTGEQVGRTDRVISMEEEYG